MSDSFKTDRKWIEKFSVLSEELSKRRSGDGIDEREYEFPMKPGVRDIYQYPDDASGKNGKEHVDDWYAKYDSCEFGPYKSRELAVEGFMTVSERFEKFLDENNGCFLA